MTFFNGRIIANTLEKVWTIRSQQQRCSNKNDQKEGEQRSTCAICSAIILNRNIGALLMIGCGVNHCAANGLISNGDGRNVFLYLIYFMMNSTNTFYPIRS